MLPSKRRQHFENLREPGFRWGFLVLFVLALALQSFVPARALANQLGEVIEICGASGVREVRVPASTSGESQTHGAACTDCASCVLCGGPAMADIPGQGPALPPAAGHELAGWPEIRLIVKSHLCSWADNRAPPVRAGQTMKSDINLFMGPPRSEGRAPWI